MLLPKIELDLLRTVERINLRPTLASAWEAGRLLSLARPLVPHGQWIPWLRRVGVSRSSAQEYLSVHAHLQESNVRQAGHLTIREFLRSMRKAKKESLKEGHAAALDKLPEASSFEGFHHGDALAFLKKMPSESVPFVITDPPFGLGVSYDGFQDAEKPEDYVKWIMPYWTEMKRVLAPGGMLVMCQAYRHLRHFWTWYGTDIVVTPVSFVVRGQTCWHPLVRWMKPGRQLIAHNNMDALYVSINDADTDTFKSVHPCPMPLSLAEMLVMRYSLPGAVVLDPFAGVAGIGVQCLRQGRKYVGVEQSRKYFDVGCRRLHNEAGELTSFSS